MHGCFRFFRLIRQRFFLLYSSLCICQKRWFRIWNRYFKVFVCVVQFFTTIFSHQAIFKMIPKEKLETLPNDENTPEKRADKLWSFFGKGERGEIGTYF